MAVTAWLLTEAVEQESPQEPLLPTRLPAAEKTRGFVAYVACKDATKPQEGGDRALGGARKWCWWSP